MNVAVAEAGFDGSAALRDAMALAALARDCVAAGVERRVLHLRLSLLPNRLRESRHMRMVREALAPLLRPTRARLYELPGGDLVALSPPPGEHLEEVRAHIARLLPEIPEETLLPVLQLPVEAARLLALVELSLGLQLTEAPAPPDPLAGQPMPSAAEVDAALRAVSTAHLPSFLRRRTIWHLAASEGEQTRRWTELRPHVADVASVLLPRRNLAGAPSLARRFRQATERRMLAELARPEEARGLGDICLPLCLGTATSVEFMRLDSVLGPQGRGRVMLCLPAQDILADPPGFDLLRRLAAQRGWQLGLDDVEAGLLALMPPARLDLAMVRLRFRPAMLSSDGAARAALDAALPADRERVVLTGADAPIAIAWGWQRGISRFMGRMLEGRIAPPP